jgi:oligopeptide transport system substrate-binding protein
VGRRLALLTVLAAVGVVFWRLQLARLDDAPPPPGEPVPIQLERGNGAEPDSLDPQLARMDSSLNVLRDAYEGLTSVGRDGSVVAGTAESWRVADGGLTYLFRLRPAARWSNGDRVTAADYVAAWRRLVDPRTASQYAQILEPVAGARAVFTGEAPPETLGVEAVDDLSLRVRLEARAGHFLALLSHPSTFPVHRPTLEQHGGGFARPGVAVTNGAFTPVEWQVGAFIRSDRNPHYWNAEQVGPDSVRYHHIADPMTELTRFRAGQLDVTYTLPPGQLESLGGVAGSVLYVAPQLGVYYYGFALDREPFSSSPRLRQALAMAIDRETLAAKVLGDGEIPAYGWVPPGVDGYDPQAFAWKVLDGPARRAAAKRLYEEAGYSTERPAEFTLSFNKSPLHDRIALAVTAMWQEVLGARVTLRAEEFRVLKQTIDARDVQAFRGSWIADYNDPYSFLQVLRGGFGINLPRYRDEAYDALLDEAAVYRDGRRAALLAEAEQRLLEAVPVVPLFFYVSKHLVAARVGGWYDNVMNVTYSKDLALAP